MNGISQQENVTIIFAKKSYQCCKKKYLHVTWKTKILEYARFVVTKDNSRILDIEGHSNKMP